MFFYVYVPYDAHATRPINLRYSLQSPHPQYYVSGVKPPCHTPVNLPFYSTCMVLDRPVPVSRLGCSPSRSFLAEHRMAGLLCPPRCLLALTTELDYPKNDVARLGWADPCRKKRLYRSVL